ncbi:MAG TPA: carbohydrate kinase [Nocardioides sp.]|nr:carbohydrate kinase [Nocardioides sp.]
MADDVLVIGESLIDVVRAADGTTTEHVGGSAANVAVALARLGRQVRFATSFADDPHGRMVAEHLERAGVRLTNDPHSIARTSTAIATLGADGAASYEFDLDWVLDPPPVDVMPAAVHVCSLGAVLTPGAEVVHAAASRLNGSALVSYDVNARPVVTGTGPDLLERVERLASVSDLVKASDEDLASFYPDLTLPDAARGLLGIGPAAVVVTRGEQGAVWFSRSGLVEVPSTPVRVADTIGAGDTFSAALLDGLLGRGDLASLDEIAIREVLHRAVRAAAVTVSRPGADPPYASELS